MKLVFLGTGSQYPSQHRGTSCIALRHENGHIWLFDCGEGSQVQLQKTDLRPGKITKIFITHLHGDHLFGLPGLLCSLGSWDPERKGTLEIYGPSGVKRFVQTALATSGALHFEYAFVVHELSYLDRQLPPDWQDWTASADDVPPLIRNEGVGRTIQADSAGIWHLYDDENVSVKASWIVHRVPCFGFVVHEKPLPGKLDAAKLVELGVHPGPLYGKIKNGEDIESPSGQVVRSSEVMGPPRAGRKVTILGDTSDPSAMHSIAVDSDVLVHEATLENALVEQAVKNGHSTPDMAAKYCKSINARCLILTHYSPRYGRLVPETTDADKCPQEARTGTDGKCVNFLLDEARATLGDGSEVFAAEDLREFDVFLPDQPRAVAPVS